MNQLVKVKTPAEAVHHMPVLSWFDDECHVRVSQFSELSFETGEVSITDHALFYVFTGVVEVSIGSAENKHIIPGQAAFHAAEEPHRARSLKPCSFLAMLFPPKYIESLADDVTNRSLTWHSNFIEEDAYLMQMMELMDKELATQDQHSHLSLSSLSAYVGIHLIRNYSTMAIVNSKGPRRGDICKIKCALEYIESNLISDMQISQLAALTQLSAYRFLQIFKDVTGQTPYQYVIRRRLEVAKHLLLKSDLSLEQIGTDTGFANQSHFTRAFRKHFGFTPAVGRRA